MDIFALLKKDHDKVKGLFEELEETSEKAVKSRENIFATIQEELTLHTQMEEKLFYPRLKEAEPTHEMTLEALAEHALAKRLLKELDAAPKGTEEWAAKAKVLGENVRHHIREEETQLFKLARKVLSREQSESLAEEAEEFKSQAQLED